MANRHFEKIADVWKHAALAEVLEREPPAWYAETHAGSGGYAVVHDREREFGILRFLEVAPRFAVLARSRYRAMAASYVKGRPRPVSALCMGPFISPRQVGAAPDRRSEARLWPRTAAGS